MLATLASLLFVLAAVVAALSLADSLGRSRDVALANVVVLRRSGETREFAVRIAGLDRHPALAGHPALRRAPHRPLSRRRTPATAAQRAAA